MKFSFFQKNQSMYKNRNSTPVLPPSSLHLLIGKDSSGHKIYIPESGLYQNFLITGTIGSGKTSSAMYPFTKQLIEFNFHHPEKKIDSDR